MPDGPPTGEAWMIAAWPGMGSVAVLSAGYLVQQLGMTETGELPPNHHFDVNEVTVREGLVVPVRPPRGVFFRWQRPGGQRELIVFLGEAQPTSGSTAYARELLDAAAAFGVRRVVTFASMASSLHPADNPKVYGVATDAATLAELGELEVEPLGDGEIGGLNGLLLSAAAERGLPGFCLLAEIPFFAAAVPNPKAARAALSVFCVLSGIEVSLEELDQHAAAVDEALIEAFEQMERSQDEKPDEDEEGDDDEESSEAVRPEQGEAPEPPAPPAAPAAPGEPKLDFAARKRIEQLFEEARKDTSKSLALKQELDRLGVFKKYEDRFLDLFRRAG